MCVVLVRCRVERALPAESLTPPNQCARLQALLQSLEDAADDVMMAEDAGNSKLLIGDIFFDSSDDNCGEHINGLKEVCGPAVQPHRKIPPVPTPYARSFY